ncbi:class I alpha-mannosidase protein [Rutstroemia sp. NJR-2017a WRK4]|nr:class I alpha-mannosidase protein [Rutstroemia sp. NJR-2017a WRK4]
MRHDYKQFYPHPLGAVPYRARLCYILLAIVTLLLFFLITSNDNLKKKAQSGLYFPRPSETPPPHIGRYKIQASFPSESKDARAIRLQRQNRVRKEFIHAWNGYKKHAWLHDEVMPLSGGWKDTFVGWAATLVDSLDTLYIMGLRKEFEDTLQTLRQIDFSRPNAERVPVFETNIRYLGGLLGAWDVSEHRYPILIEKAKQLGDLLYEAFNTESGIPAPYYWWNKQREGKIPGENGVLVAQIASLSLEFIRLSQVTGDSKYSDAIQRITDQLQRTQNVTSLPGMWPAKANCMGPGLAFTSSSYTLGAFADSAFEYLPKTHLLLPASKSSQQYLDMYRNALASFSKNLFFRPNLPGNPKVLFPGSAEAPSGSPHLHTQVQHLACFVGGMVGLGSRLSKSSQELDLAIQLTNGCVWAYENTPTGIMPEIFHVDRCADPSSCQFTWEGNGFTRIDDPSYQLRPEAIESVFIMYRLTADGSWQEKGWKMFEAIAKHTRTDIANARIQNVMSENPELEDSMESFWLAETLKYFYLLYSEPDVVSLDEYVLNTEAHPLRQASG